MGRSRFETGKVAEMGRNNAIIQTTCKDPEQHEQKGGKIQSSNYSIAIIDESIKIISILIDRSEI